ncbi:MAG: DUF3098 domain-containing protein [Ichthyobacteriaceae bacterium]|nr:DUF3098 domain-containing protein [Ichthyobacteriaceae bacterium]
MNESKFLFGKKNYTLMAIGVAIIALGYILMSGGSSESADNFNYEMFSVVRIRIAPLLVIIGFVVNVWAILAKPSK